MKNDCESIESQLSAYLDNELPPTERTVVEKHLSNCPRCQRKLAELKTLAAGVTALPRLQPAPQFLADVRRKIARPGKSPGRAWQDYLFRPVWLKVPLETVAVVLIVVLMMRIERPAGERTLKYEARKDVGHGKVTTLAANQSQPMDKPASMRTVGGAIDEGSQPPTRSAPVAAARSMSTGELPQEAPAVVVVVHAKDFNDVQNHAQQFAATMNGRILSSLSRGGAAQSFFVELPRENVASFKSQLLRSTEQARAVDAPALADGAGAVSKSAPLPASTPGVGPGVPTGIAGTNLVPVGGSDRLRSMAEPKAATAVLEIQVVPPTN